VHCYLPITIYLQIISHKENIYAYEVFLKKVRPDRMVYGKVVPTRECFPHDEAFGKWAWSYWTLDMALKRFELLEDKS